MTEETRRSAPVAALRTMAIFLVALVLSRYVVYERVLVPWMVEGTFRTIHWTLNLLPVAIATVAVGQTLRTRRAVLGHAAVAALTWAAMIELAIALRRPGTVQNEPLSLAEFPQYFVGLGLVWALFAAAFAASRWAAGRLRPL